MMSASPLLTRRDALHLAAGLGLSFALPALETRAANERGKQRNKSLLVVFLAGGASQLETWDPHPNSKTGGETQAIKTTLSGCDIASFYPQVAEQLGELNVIRSLSTKEGDHERGATFMKTGYRPDPILTYPSLGAIVTHELPAEGLEIPPHVSLADGQFPARGGFLGDAFDAFRVFDPGRHLHNMKSFVGDGERQQRRVKGLEVVSKSFAQGRRIQTDNTLHQLTVQRALTMMSSDQLKAFDIADESDAVKSAYGDHRFGRGCLVARRLLETGVRAIEVTLNGWDSHANNHSGQASQAEMLDPALGTLLKDLKSRDLLQSTVVLVIGEFGRTPSINPLGGRDHWPKWFSCLVGGGGLTRGQLIGETDPDGSKDPKDPLQVQDLYATLLKVLGVEYSKEVITQIGRPIKLSSGQPIDRLIA